MRKTKNQLELEAYRLRDTTRRELARIVGELGDVRKALLVNDRHALQRLALSIDKLTNLHRKL